MTGEPRYHRVCDTHCANGAEGFFIQPAKKRQPLVQEVPDLIQMLERDGEVSSPSTRALDESAIPDTTLMRGNIPEFT